MTTLNPKNSLTSEQMLQIIIDSLQLLRDVPADIRNIKEEVVSIRRDMADMAVTLQHQHSK